MWFTEAELIYNVLYSKVIQLCTHTHTCIHTYIHIYVEASQVALVVKNLPVNTVDIRDRGSIPESRRYPEEGHGNTLQYSYLENSMEPGRLQFIGYRFR